MDRNVGMYDKSIRAIVAVVLVAIGWYLKTVPTYVTYLLYAFAAILLLTVVFSRCPIYSMFGCNSRTYRLSKISRRDIERAVKDYPVNNFTASLENVGSSKTKLTKKASAKKSAKKVAKKPAKKSPTKKTSAAKGSTKKVVKKAPAKKTTKKTPTKKTSAAKSSTKKVVKKAPAKKTTKESVAKKKTPTKKKSTSKK